MIAALSGDGVAELKRYLAGHVPEGPWLYPEDELSDIPVRQLAAEVTREKIYDNLHDELPYQMTVETESWKTLRDKSVRVEQRSSSSATARRASCSARAGRRSRRSRRPRAAS